MYAELVIYAEFSNFAEFFTGARGIQVVGFCFQAENPITPHGGSGWE